MPDINDVLEDVQREVKSFGDDVKSLKDSMHTDLAAVRKLAEDAPKSVLASADFKKDLEALAAGVLEKSDAIDKKFKKFGDDTLAPANERMDELEKKLNRMKISGGWGDEDEGTKAARAFARDAAIVRGEVKVGTPFTDEKFDREQIKAYRDTLPLYLRRDEKSLQGAETKAMSVGSDPDGGYLVTPNIGTVITGIQFETSPLRSLANIETISSDAIEYPRDDDEASAGWVGEQETRTDTGTPKIGVQRIPANELYAIPKATQKLLEDAAWDVEAWLGRKIGDKFGRVEATAFVSGNGVKKPRGFLTYASGTYAAGSSGSIEQLAAATSATVAWDDLIKLLSKLKEYYLNGACWLMQRSTVGTLMTLKDGDGRYLWQPNQQAGKPSVLLGYDVRQAADMDAVAGSKLPIAFGNFKMGYTIVDRVGISTLRDPYSAKPFVQFYSRKRVGGDVTNFEAIKLLAT